MNRGWVNHDPLDWFGGGDRVERDVSGARESANVIREVADDDEDQH